MLPFWTSFLVRTYAWMFLLRDTGLINTVLLASASSTSRCRCSTTTARCCSAWCTATCRSWCCRSTPRSNGSTRRCWKPRPISARALAHASCASIVPLAAPGIRAGAVLVFIPCLGAYLTPDLLGGGKTVLVGNLVQNQFTTARDWPFGSAASTRPDGAGDAAAARRPAPRKRGAAMKRCAGRSTPSALYAFLHLPLLILAVLQLQLAREFTVWEGFSLDWYRAAFRDPQLVEAAWNSLLIALVATAALHRRSARCAPTGCGSAARASLTGVAVSLAGHAGDRHRHLAAGAFPVGLPLSSTGSSACTP